MADPLSIAASITGLIGVAGQVTIMIKGFIASVVDAPESARSALAAVEEMGLVLMSVKQVIDKLSQLPRHRKAMIHVRHLVVIFRESILSFSHLEALLKPTIARGFNRQAMSWQRIQWVAEENKILEAVARLEGHKTSISLMLIILQCESDIEAKDRFETLQEKVDMLVAHAMSQPLMPGSIQYDFYHGSEEASMRFLEDDQTTLRPVAADNYTIYEMPATKYRFNTFNRFNKFIPDARPVFRGTVTPREFEVVLESTRVYKRVQSHESDISFTSSVVGTQGWSMLSGLSLNDISVISVIALPITLEEINRIGGGLSFSKIISTEHSFDNPGPAQDGKLHMPLLTQESDPYNYRDKVSEPSYWLTHTIYLSPEEFASRDLADFLFQLSRYHIDKYVAKTGGYDFIEYFWTHEHVTAMAFAFSQLEDLCSQVGWLTENGRCQLLVNLMKNFEMLLQILPVSSSPLVQDEALRKIKTLRAEFSKMRAKYALRGSDYWKAWGSDKSLRYKSSRSIIAALMRTRRAKLPTSKPSPEDADHLSILPTSKLPPSVFPISKTSLSLRKPAVVFNRSSEDELEDRMEVYRLVVLGDGGSGKTELIVRFTLDDLLNDAYVSIIDDSYRKKIVVDGENCVVDVLDTASQEEYTALRHQWIKEADGFLIVYSVMSRSNFERVPKLYNQVEKATWPASTETGLQSPPASSEDLTLPLPPVIIVVGNHTDLTETREVSKKEGTYLAERLGCSFVEVSTKYDINIEKAFIDVVRQIRKQRMRNIPARKDIRIRGRSMRISKHDLMTV